MVDSLTFVLSIIIILSLMVVFSIQRTSSKCGHVFQAPSPQLIRQHLPGGGGRSQATAQKINAAIKTDAIAAADQANTNASTESLNDRVNEHYLNNPYNKRGNGPGNGMADIPNTLWLSTSSQSGKSDDGRVINDTTESQDMTTHGFRNNQMDGMTELMSQNMSKSRVADYQHEMI